MNNVPYTYTGGFALHEKEFSHINFKSIPDLYDKVEDLIAKKIGCDKKAVEVVKFSYSKDRDYGKFDYRLHFDIDNDDIRCAVVVKIPYKVTEVKCRAADEKLFVVELTLETDKYAPNEWREKLNLYDLEAAVGDKLPKGLIPCVKICMHYPVASVGSYYME